jgi:hypothetical protein
VSPVQRVLAGVSRVVVALWLAVGLAWFSGEEHLALEPAVAELAARVEALPEPVDPVEPSESQPVASIGAAELAEGSRLLDAGRFPPISASYDEFGSFAEYAAAMESLGARFVVVRNRRIVSGADRAAGRLVDPDLDAELSPRARDYTDEPGLSELARRARERFGPGAIVMMLVPRELDAGLFGGIARLLGDRGESPDGYREIRARYERAPDGGVRLRVTAGLRSDGTRIELERLFDLAGISEPSV